MKDKNILIYHIGQLGDTLVSVPSLHVIRESFPKAKLTLLCDKHKDDKYVMATDILFDSGLVDGFLHYPVLKYEKNWVSKKLTLLSLSFRLRSCNFDTMVYLLPSRRGCKQIKRDIFFFRLVRIKHFMGDRGFYTLPKSQENGQLPHVPHEADILLSRLGTSGLKIPNPGKGNTSVNINPSEERFVDTWLVDLPPDGGRKWIAVGPGSKMPVKLWPEKYYLEVLSRLIDKYDVWPVIFGGKEDASLAKDIVTKLGRGYIAVGTLNVRQAIAAMKRCQMFLGNDSGPMHMAVSAGLKCVALFSARDYPGKWYPYGDGHSVFRNAVDCQGCMLEKCGSKNTRCLLSILPDDVFDACEKKLLTE